MRRTAPRHQPYRAYEPPQSWYPSTPPAPPRPPAIDRFLNMVVWIIVIGLGLFAAYLLAVPGTPLPLPMQPTVPAGYQSRTTGGDTGDTTQRGAGQSAADYNATAEAVYQAAIHAQAAGDTGAVQPAPAVAAQLQQPATWPTAAITMPTVAPVSQITVVPIAYPQTYASNDAPTITPIPTLVYPTPLPAAVASNSTLSPDGKCVSAPRNGTIYQVCQDWKYQPNEIATVADYIRTGLLPGVAVTP